MVCYMSSVDSLLELESARLKTRPSEISVNIRHNLSLLYFSAKQNSRSYNLQPVSDSFKLRPKLFILQRLDTSSKYVNIRAQFMEVVFSELLSFSQLSLLPWFSSVSLLFFLSHSGSVELLPLRDSWELSFVVCTLLSFAVVSELFWSVWLSALPGCEALSLCEESSVSVHGLSYLWNKNNHESSCLHPLHFLSKIMSIIRTCVWTQIPPKA